MAEKRNNYHVTLLAGGDIGPDFEPADAFAQLISPLLRQADLRFAQCERVYSERPWDPHYATKVEWDHACLHPRLASVWKAAGIDIISMASNHTMDCGPETLADTIKLFHGMGKQTIGAGRNEAEARTPAIVERNGVRIAFLGYCSVLPEGHEAGPDKGGSAPMRIDTFYQRGKDQHEEYQPGEPPMVLTMPWQQDLQALQEDIRKAKQQADALVMSIHWGIHNIPKAIATYQPMVAHAAIDAGADLILGHHAHILKAIEVYKGKVCFYSLGNFMKTTDKMPRPSAMNLWNLWWYRPEPEYMSPDATYHLPLEACKSMVAKIVFSKKGVERVSFVPAFINPQAQPAVVAPSDPKFLEIVDYVEWISDQFPHKFRVEGHEVVVDTSA